MASGIRVEVVYAAPQGAEVVALELPAGASVSEAVRASGLLARPGVSIDRVGIFGKTVAPQTRLADGDRVELYRPLAGDPKERRRARARRRPSGTSR